jgi:serine/threonine protein kinase
MSDVWGLGCILYEMTTLKRAFEGNSLPALVAKILRGRFSPIPSRYSMKLCSLIHSMLARNPNRRPSVETILKLPWMRRCLSTCASRESVAYVCVCAARRTYVPLMVWHAITVMLSLNPIAGIIYLRWYYLQFRRLRYWLGNLSHLVLVLECLFGLQAPGQVCSSHAAPCTLTGTSISTSG